MISIFAKPKRSTCWTNNRQSWSFPSSSLASHTPAFLGFFLGSILGYMLGTSTPGGLNQPAIWLPILSQHCGLPIADFFPQPWNGLSYCFTLYQASLSYYQTGLLSTRPKLAPPSRHPLPVKGATIHPVAQANFAKILILFLLSSHFQSSRKPVDSGFQKKKKNLDWDHFFLSSPLGHHCSASIILVIWTPAAASLGFSASMFILLSSTQQPE